jgi:uncharacterized iron-regulated membrane protein
VERLDSFADTSRMERRTLRLLGLWIRKSTFQLHLWLGAIAMAYILFVSVSGCAIVFERELFRFFSPDPQVTSQGSPRLTTEELVRAARLKYPHDLVVSVWDKRLSTDVAAEIWLEGQEGVRRRLFHPYSGADMGDAQPVSLRTLALLRNAHVDLLTGSTGRAVHGSGAIALIVLSLSGAGIWWAGKNRRRRQGSNSKWRTWKFHSTAGVWTFVFAMIWGTTGVCFAFPSILQAMSGSSTVGEQAFRWLYIIHSGAAGGWSTRMIWVVSGLATTFLAITGMMMWWKRVSKSGQPSASLSPE